MTYETMDWEAEAKRVCQAFGIKEESEFEVIVPGMRWLKGKSSQGRISVDYRNESRYFHVSSTSGYPTALVINWDGTITEKPVCGPETPQDSEFMARALFDLDLLTLEIETALAVNISSHQKLEWMMEKE